jgi:hypothetical protein
LINITENVGHDIKLGFPQISSLYIYFEQEVALYFHSIESTYYCCPGFQVIGGVLKKFRLAKRGATILVVFCVKNQDFMPKIIFFPILGGSAGCASPFPHESATGSGIDNNST